MLRQRLSKKKKRCADLERLLIDVNIVADFCLLGLAEKDEVLKEKDAPHAFLLSKKHSEVVLANQLALLL